jgi:hypothetical protein
MSWQTFLETTHKTDFMLSNKQISDLQHSSIPHMNTLTACVNKAQKEGYTQSFMVTRQGLQSAADETSTYSPRQIKVVNFYRFEGQSDPADNSILYVIETSDGKKGMLIDAYGAYADDKVNKFMNEVEDINKKTEKR